MIHGDQRKDQDLFGDGSAMLYTRRSGYAGVSYVVSNTTSKEAVKVELNFDQSKNVVSHRGSLKAAVIVPPNEAKVVHHMMPRDDTHDWSAGWSCAADWMSVADMKAELEKESKQDNDELH